MSRCPDGVVAEEPPAPLRRRCASCLTTRGELKLCTGCRLVRYCRAEHQARHWPQHRGLCRKAGRLRDRVRHEDRRVRHAAAPDAFTPANAFETDAGRFGEVLSTRAYVLARLDAGDHAVRCGTRDGVVAALDHLQDLVRLDRRDGLRLRELVPAQMLRLDRDQECYDFVKWWETCGADRHYDWSDTTLPFLSVRDADVLEEPVFLLSKWTPLSFQSAVLLLKLKLLVDIRNLKVARKVVRNRLPVELCALVEAEVIRSPLSARFTGRADLEGVEDALVNQCYYLGVHMGQSNRHLLRALLAPPRERPPMRPGHGGPKCSPEEAMMAMEAGYQAWLETPGALELLEEARGRAEMSWQADAGWPAGTKKEPFDLGLMWEHLDCAVKGRSYLGPAEETRGEALMRMMEDDIRALWVDGMGEA